MVSAAYRFVHDDALGEQEQLTEKCSKSADRCSILCPADDALGWRHQILKPNVLSRMAQPSQLVALHSDFDWSIAGIGYM
jgi:hypothetical protein